MNLAAYLSFDILFDLSAYPKMVLTDTSQYPEGVSGQKVWFEVVQPDGINLPAGSGQSVEVPLRLGRDQRYQCGRYVVKMCVTHGSDLSVMSRDFEMTYREVTLKLTEDFDVFTPRLRYRDDTSYDVPTYNITENAASWVAAVGDGGALGIVSGSGSTLDLELEGNYYSARYQVNFERTLTYTHEVYPWLRVRDKYARSMAAKAIPPLSIEEMLEALAELHVKLGSDTCAHGINSEAGRFKYLYAESLANNIIHCTEKHRNREAAVLLRQFMRLVSSSRDVTNEPLRAYFDARNSYIKQITLVAGGVDGPQAGASSFTLRDRGVAVTGKEIVLDRERHPCFYGQSRLGFTYDAVTGQVTVTEPFFPGELLRVTVYDAGTFYHSGYGGWPQEGGGFPYTFPFTLGAGRTQDSDFPYQLPLTLL